MSGTPPAPDAVVVLCAIPADFDPHPLAAALVEARLAACVQIGLGVTSVYRWKGAIEKGEERLLLIKTRRTKFAELEAMIRARHPYDVPEIVALPISEGHAPYLAWLAAETAA